MIISASYRTDIPTFYGEWFIQRLRAGYCFVINPYNRQAYRVSLGRQDVDGFVFWTKNPAPFLRHLEEVHGEGYPFMVQFTINGYPRILETSVVDASRSVEMAWKLREVYGRHAVVWRYDTIVLSSVTPSEFHIENFRHLATQLTGATDEVVVSFAQAYKKTRRNLDQAAKESDFNWWDPTSDVKQDLLRQLLRIAREMRLNLVVCSQPDLVVEGTAEARCVDARRLTTMTGQGIHARLKGSRKECGCYESRDIGDYDTCPHGCVYCYAVQNRGLALDRFRKHDPQSEFLFQPPAASGNATLAPKRTPQMALTFPPGGDE